MTIYILQKTDNWHETAKREILAVCTTVTKAVRLAGKVAREEGSRLTVQQKEDLARCYQTQGYEYGEFLITETESNTIIE